VLAATVAVTSALTNGAAAAGGGSSSSMIRAEFGPAGPCMVHVAWRESRLNPRAVNWADHHSDGSRGSFGLFQIGALWRRAGESVDSFYHRMIRPRANVRLAHVLYARYGLRPWGGFC